MADDDAQHDADSVPQASEGLSVDTDRIDSAGNTDATDSSVGSSPAVGGESVDTALDADDLETETSVVEGDDGQPVVTRETRTAAFAEVADRPKKKALEGDKNKNDIEFFDDLRKFDAELAGTIRAQCQSAASGLSVTHPAIEGERSDMNEMEEKITRACRDLVDELDLREDASTYFRNAVTHGNDVSHIQYEEQSEDGEGGVTDLTPLPLRIMTIVDEQTARDGFYQNEPASLNGTQNYDKLITSPDFYVLSEENDNARQVLPAHDVLHIARNQRGNWHDDRLGRTTYNVWGERALEPIKYAVQTKQNTLANKVAMDDKLLTREYYQINVEELFGHLEDPDRRQEEVERYAGELREKLEDLDADQKPIIPEEVSVEVKGPQGETARNMAEFIETMNNSIQHALTYHVASFGRDAGGTDRGNRPAKEMSENTVRQLRDVVKTSFRELFKIHAMLRFEDARELTNPEFDDVRRYELADDIVLPELKFDPVDPENRNDEVRNAATMYEKGFADLNEARAEVSLEPIDEFERDERMWQPQKNPTTMDEDIEQEQMMNESDGSGGDGSSGSNPNDEPTESRPSRTDSTDASEDPRTDRTERVGGEE